MSAPPPLTVFVNQPDVYRAVDFSRFPAIGQVYWTRPDAAGAAAVDAILTGFKDVIDDAFLAPFPNVRIVGSNTTGVDHIRPTRSGIAIVKLEAADVAEISATAEFTLALLLSLVRKLPFIDYRALTDWTTECRGVQLRGKTIGIFGLGRLGSKMARYAEALEMRVAAYDRSSTAADKRQLLETADVISIHLPLAPDTVDFIDDAEFGLMRRTAFVVNTARPQIIRKDALIRALEQRLVAGVAMDFLNYDATTVVDPALERFTGTNLFLTPHMGGNTHESVAFTAEVVVRKTIAATTDRPA